jgi:hypothetical protein
MCVETRRKMSAQRRKFPQLTANLQIPREPNPHDQAIIGRMQ